MRWIERDGFTPATGYPPGLVSDGPGMRDRARPDCQVDASQGLGG
jgi:hypothetical protein